MAIGEKWGKKEAKRKESAPEQSPSWGRSAPEAGIADHRRNRMRRRHLGGAAGRKPGLRERRGVGDNPRGQIGWRGRERLRGWWHFLVSAGRIVEDKGRR